MKRFIYYYDICRECGNQKELLMGEDYSGWAFLLCCHPDKGINSLEDWEKFVKNRSGQIRCFDDEERWATNGTYINSWDEFIKLIINRNKVENIGKRFINAIKYHTCSIYDAEIKLFRQGRVLGRHRTYPIDYVTIIDCCGII